MLNRDKETACLIPIFGDARVKRDFTLLMLDNMYYRLVGDGPTALQGAFSREECSPERLIKNLTATGMTLQQDETLPYTVLLQELRKFGILTTDLSRSDHHRLLRALARAPENQLVIPVLFVLLYSEWYRRHNAQMDATKDDEGWLLLFGIFQGQKERRKERNISGFPHSSICIEVVASRDGPP